MQEGPAKRRRGECSMSKYEVIPFNEFLIAGFNSHFYNPFDFSGALWFLGGMGVIVIGLSYLEKKGVIGNSHNIIKFGLVLLYAYLVGKYFITGSFWNLLI